MVAPVATPPAQGPSQVADRALPAAAAAAPVAVGGRLCMPIVCHPLAVPVMVHWRQQATAPCQPVASGCRCDLRMAFCSSVHVAKVQFLYLEWLNK